jgi:hypothetical protein
VPGLDGARSVVCQSAALASLLSEYSLENSNPTPVSIIPASPSLLADGWTLYSERPDKEWSLTDCTSFVVMTHEHMTQAFTSDHHFEQAGFVKLL